MNSSSAMALAFVALALGLASLFDPAVHGVVGVMLLAAAVYLGWLGFRRGA